MDFRVLGPFKVADGDRTVALGGPQQRTVLALLVLEPDRVVSMDQLIDHLWGEDPPAQATGTVHAYVSNLRRALEPGRRPGEPPRLLVSRPPGYALRVAPADVDWLRFEQLVDRAREARAAGDLRAADGLLVEARALWRGALLADLPSIAGHARDRLDERRLAAIEDHAEVLLALGRHAEVVGDLEAIAGEHPLRERPRGLLMLALYRAGRQADALAVYRDVRRLLAEELGIDPGADLRRLQEQVLRQDPVLDPVLPDLASVRHRPDAGPAMFVGREVELAVLRGHLEATRAGSGRVLVIEGDPGVGKTRLGEVVAAEAAAEGVLVLWGRCAEGAGAPPLWPWLQVLRAAGDDRQPAALVPDRAQLDPLHARGQLHQAVADLLREWTRTRRLLLVLDDLQWADVTSLALLEFLAADLTNMPILVLGAYREVDLVQAPRLAATLGVLARLPGADRVALHGLSVDEVAALIRAHSGAEPAAGLAAAVHRRTAGNPFFVTELLRLEDPRRLEESGRMEDGPVPAGVRDVVRHRVARLPHAARALLDTAALAGPEFDLRLVAGLCGFEGDTGAEAVEAALVAGLLTVVPDRLGTFRFTHALVLETLAGDLTPLHQARLHERLALALLDAHGDSDEHAAAVAEHLWASLPAGDVEQTLRAQARAAEVAWVGLAYETAEALLERASTLLQSLPAGDSPPGVDLDVHIRLGSLRSARHGHTVAARAAFERARVLAERLDRRGDLLPALWGLGASAVVRGDLSAAGELTEAALEQARHIPGGLALAQGHQGVGIVAFYRGRLAAARRHFADALAVWRDAGGPAAAALRGPPANARPDVMTPSYDALAAALMGDPAGGQRQIEGAVRAAEATGEPYVEAFVHSFHARFAALMRDPGATRTAATKAITIAEAHGFPMLVRHAAILLGWAQAGRGEPETGLVAIQGGLAALERSGQSILTPFHQGLQAEVQLALDDGVGALALLDEALAESAARGGGFETPDLHHLRGLALKALGRRVEARAALQAAIAEAGEMDACVPQQRAITVLTSWGAGS